MKIAVVVRQVPDLIEPLEIAESQQEVDLDGATFVVNESDDHALEQALLIKEGAPGSEVCVVALDYGDVENTLYTAAAKGTDRIVRVQPAGEPPFSPRQQAAMLCPPIQAMEPDLVLIGSYAHDELESSLAPLLASELGLPYAGVIRGVQATDDGSGVVICKEFSGAAMARLQARLPTVLGIVGAEQPPRYVPVSRIRACMKTAQIEDQPTSISPPDSLLCIERMRPAASSARAEMIEGSEEEASARIVSILQEKGVIR